MWPLSPSWHLARRALSACSFRQAKRALTPTTAGTPRSDRPTCSILKFPTNLRAMSNSAVATGNGSSKSRAYPTEPRVGVGVVVFRTQPLQGHDPEILLVRRAKEPDKGRWCFPGGSLELGESLAACAAREVEEEAGLRLHDARAAAGTPPEDGGGGADAAAGVWNLLQRGPTPFAAVDVMSRDADDRIRFHYAVIEVAAVSCDPGAVPVPGDDADGAQWVPVSRLRGMADLTVRCDEMAEEAVRRFAIAPPLPA